MVKLKDLNKVFAVLVSKKQIDTRYTQMINFFKYGVYIELSGFFLGIEPFQYDFNEKTIGVLDNIDNKKHIEKLLNGEMGISHYIKYSEEVVPSNTIL